MLLKKIRLKNFRQFSGEQEIIFSDDKEKNVTIIIAENGAGKTTVAQAFTWCFYGRVNFKDKFVLSKLSEIDMNVDDEEIVKVEVELEHLGVKYTISRKQTYRKKSNRQIKAENSVFNILYKDESGKQQYINLNRTETTMNEILPEKLSRYFFFDGERIESMSKEIGVSKVHEFSDAVKGLLGLNAIISAIDHLKGAMRSFENEYDSKSDSKIKQYNADIRKYEEAINKIDNRLEEIKNEENIAESQIKKLEREIEKYKESEDLVNRKRVLQNQLKQIEQSKKSITESILRQFNSKGTDWMLTCMMKDTLELLKQNDKIDKGIPDIHEKTIKYLIDERHKCICGAEIEFGNEVYKNLIELLDYIPPKSIGTLIKELKDECKYKYKIGEEFFENIKHCYSQLSEKDYNYTLVSDDISDIETKISGMDSVGELQKKLNNYKIDNNKLSKERDILNSQRGSNDTKLKMATSERDKLVLLDDKNKKIAEFRAYAMYVHDTLKENYEKKEEEIRVGLEKNINKIFDDIYSGGFSLKIDNDYNIQVIVDNYRDVNEIETSTAQSYSIIFAFIAAVIKMAKENKASGNEMLMTEAYPLVMDAPLSSFDKKRIKSVCEVLPKFAEQVIIFIKDTDGEIAETYLSNKIGKKYSFIKKSEIETELIKR